MRFAPHQLKQSAGASKGFSLIELIVVISIFTIITSIILVKHSQFSGTILLGNLAYDVALSIREAQVFGLASRGFAPAGSSEFEVGYGIHFDETLGNSYVFFVDIDANRRYAGGTERLETFSLTQGSRIADFCVTTAGTEYCALRNEINDLDITFLRPNPDAKILSDIVYGGAIDGYDSARIVVGARNAERSILVYTTGQISVNQP